MVTQCHVGIDLLCSPWPPLSRISTEWNGPCSISASHCESRIVSAITISRRVTQRKWRRCFTRGQLEPLWVFCPGHCHFVKGFSHALNNRPKSWSLCSILFCWLGASSIFDRLSWFLRRMHRFFNSSSHSRTERFHWKGKAVVKICVCKKKLPTDIETKISPEQFSALALVSVWKCYSPRVLTCECEYSCQCKIVLIIHI